MTIGGHWGFIVASYALVVGGTAALLIRSWRAMRRAEAEAGQ